MDDKTAPVAGTTQAVPDSVSILKSSFTGNIIINGGAGNDNLTIDLADGDFDRTITFHGDDPTLGSGDSLTLLGGMRSFTNVTHALTNASSGTIDITGNATITYTGLEPV